MKIRMLAGPFKGKIVEPCTAQAKQWIADRTAEAVAEAPAPKKAGTLDGEQPRDMRKRHP